MTNAAILQPVLAMFVLTAVVWVVLYARRLPAMRKAGVPTQTYTTPDKGAALLPESVAYPANNFRNLFELPVLFYALCLYLYVTGTADATDVTAAWVFMGFRAVHSAIHCTVNIVIWRFAAYLVSTLALFFMIGRAVARAGWF
ncbi:MAG TPA: MAPEG family protein [Woeseiaceae bacterium]